MCFHLSVYLQVLERFLSKQAREIWVDSLLKVSYLNCGVVLFDILSSVQKGSGEREGEIDRQESKQAQRERRGGGALTFLSAKHVTVQISRFHLFVESARDRPNYSK